MSSYHSSVAHARELIKSHVKPAYVVARRQGAEAYDILNVQSWAGVPNRDERYSYGVLVTATYIYDVKVCGLDIDTRRNN